MAYRLSLLLNTSPEMWLDIQRDYDLWQIRQKSGKVKISPLVVNKLQPNKSDMLKNWTST